MQAYKQMIMVVKPEAHPPIFTGQIDNDKDENLPEIINHTKPWVKPNRL